MAASPVAFAWFVQQATKAVAVVGSVIGLVGPVPGSPVKRKIILKTSVTMVAIIVPNMLPNALLLLCVCCCVLFKLLLIVVLLSVSVPVPVVCLLIVAFMPMSGAVTVSVGEVFVGGSSM